MPSTFTLHEISAGVWAAVAPGTAGPAVSNAAIIDLGDKTVVVDTFMTVVAAREIASEAMRLTGRDPFLVVNSHWHSDHVGGNRVFEGTPIVGTERMRELIIEDSPKTPEEFAERTAAVAEAAESLAADANTPEKRELADGTRALAAAMAAESGSYRMVLPDKLIGDRLDIEGERSVSIINAGRAHTESDLFIHMPDDGIVVAGDLVWTGMHPKTNHGFPAEWAAALDTVAKLAPARVIAGHGPPGTVADIAAMADYMRQLDTLLAEVRAGDLDPDAAKPPPGTEDWQGLSRFRKSLGLLAAR